MSRPRTISVISVTILSTAALGVFAVAPATAQPFGYHQLNPVQQRHVSGLLSTVLNGEDPANAARALAPNRATPSAAAPCANRFGANVKVNQNCLNLTDPDLQGRAQAQNETWVAADPNNPAHLIASYNDYRRGDGTCGRQLLPRRRPHLGRRDHAERLQPRHRLRRRRPRVLAVRRRHVGGVGLARQRLPVVPGVQPRQRPCRRTRTSPARSCVFRSTGTNGASWNFPGRPVATHDDTAGAGNFLLDKQLLTVDNNPRSPFARPRLRDLDDLRRRRHRLHLRVAYSADYGETFSAPVLVSTDSSVVRQHPRPADAAAAAATRTRTRSRSPARTARCTWCSTTSTTPVTGSGQPQPGAAGPLDRRRPELLDRRYWSATTTSCPTAPTYQNGQDPGRACVPEKGPSANSMFRASNYPIGAVDPTHPQPDRGHLRLLHQPELQRVQRLHPGRRSPPTGVNTYTGVKNGGCNNDILLSASDQLRRQLLRRQHRSPAARRWSPPAAGRPAPTSSGRRPRSPQRHSRRQLLRPAVRRRRDTPATPTSPPSTAPT